MIKKCLECDSEFVVEIKEGSGGTAQLRKRYCSEGCKRKYKQKNGKNNYIIVNCNICDKEIKKFPSLVKQNNYCSKKCQNIALNGIQKIDVKECVVCRKEYSYISTSKRGNIKKYCSYECFKKGPRKQKTGSFIECINCNKKFYCKKYMLKTRKYCSNNCQFESQSKGIKKLPTNGRTGYRRDLPDDQYFKSAFEADYARYLIANNITYQYEKHTFKIIVDGKDRFYTPDFYIPSEDKFIELKGSKTKTAYNKNLDSVEYLKQNNKNIEVIFMDDFYAYLKQINQYDILALEAKNYKKSISALKE